MIKRIVLITASVLFLGWGGYLMMPGEPERQVSSVAGSAVVPDSRQKEQSPLVPLPAQPPSESPVAQSAPQPQPLEPEIRKALGELLNTSSEGLVEETQNGVTSVDLQKRFQTAPVATIDADGNIHITDYSYLPESADSK